MLTWFQLLAVGRDWPTVGVCRSRLARHHRKYYFLLSAGFVTSAEEGGYVFGAVCLSVCLSVCRITRKLVNGF